VDLGQASHCVYMIGARPLQPPAAPSPLLNLQASIRPTAFPFPTNPHRHVHPQLSRIPQHTGSQRSRATLTHIKLYIAAVILSMTCRTLNQSFELESLRQEEDGLVVRCCSGHLFSGYWTLPVSFHLTTSISRRWHFNMRRGGKPQTGSNELLSLTVVYRNKISCALKVRCASLQHVASSHSEAKRNAPHGRHGRV